MAVERAGEMSSPLQQQHQHYQRHNSFRPIVDSYSNSLSGVRSPQNCRQWTMTAAYLDDAGEVEAGVWTDDGDYNHMVRRHHHRRLPQQQPPAYSCSPPQSLYRRPTPVSPAPILRPDNYTLKRHKPAPPPPTTIADGTADLIDPEVDGGHLLEYLGEPVTTAGGDTTDSGYSLHRSTAPPSPAPLDNV